MKHPTNFLMVILIISFSFSAVSRENNEDEIISIYEGSRVVYDDKPGFEEYPVVTGDSDVTIVEGVLRRQWCQTPEGCSPLEIIRNYKSAIRSRGGEILFSTRDPQSTEIFDESLTDYFKTHRRDRGLSTSVFSYTHFPGEMSEYIVGKVLTGESDVYIIIASGYGHWAARQDNVTFFELVTLEAEPMEMGLVTMDSLREGLEVRGRVAVYNIYFYTGESAVRHESTEALEVITEFLKKNPMEQYLVVGHTDNVGGYDMNLELSEARARAVVEKLVDEYDIDPEQLKPVGVGPASPVLSNSTEEGRARNRRVEIVEM